MRVRSLTLFYEEWLGKLPISELERASLLFDIREVHHSGYGRAKRIIDVPIALLGLVLLAFVLPVVWLGNLIANRGPLFYRQERVGKGGTHFTILKFRTMTPRPSSDLTSEWTSEDDPRITSFGRLLRSTHLDELPQVMNILKGDLGVVGPRPEQPHYVQELSEKLPFYPLRHLVRPGLTGWAQVKYGYAGNESRCAGEAPVRVLVPAPPEPRHRPEDHRPHDPVGVRQRGKWSVTRTGPDLVTVLVPAYNEAAEIEHCINAIAAQSVGAERIQLVVVDGDSDDGTAALAAAGGASPVCRGAGARQPGSIHPSSLNLGLAEARGQVLCRVDARAFIPPDYVRRCVELLEDRRIAVVGGVQLAVATPGAGVVARDRAGPPEPLCHGSVALSPAAQLGARRHHVSGGLPH